MIFLSILLSMEYNLEPNTEKEEIKIRKRKRKKSVMRLKKIVKMATKVVLRVHHQKLLKRVKLLNSMKLS